MSARLETNFVKTKFISIDKNLENCSQENTKNSKKSQEEVKQ